MPSAALAARPATGDPLLESVRRAAARLVSLQQADGSWSGEYGGPGFLLPMYVAARHLAGRPLSPARRDRVVAYLRSVQNTDGSLGLHVEAEGSVFTTVLGYVALRQLGVARGDAAASRMRAWILAHGTALGAAPWGKHVLALLGLYPYEGLAPLPPELWLLPRAVPIHPGRLWCHCRQVYLPLSWLYGRRAAAPCTDLTRALREEIYDRPYGAIPFEAHRQTVAPEDDLVPMTALGLASSRLLALFEAARPRALRARALDEVLDHIRAEDRATGFVRIGPVNAVLNTLVHHFSDPSSDETERSFLALEGYLFDGPDGTLMNGYNSTALWDTVFAVQALLSTPGVDDAVRASLVGGHAFIRDNQVLEDVPEAARYHRHASRGGWPFSDRTHGWPITDCTAEGLKCALALAPLVEEPIPEELLEASARLLLSFQNPDGGWATYERTRVGKWIEALNPSRVFSGIMQDPSYVECTSACLQALARVRGRFGGRLDRELDRAVTRGDRFLREHQRGDGSWYGSWAVCFTYGTWFGVLGLLAASADPADEAIARACTFLSSRQLPDGGWGEDSSSCRLERYVPAVESHPVQTAWALHTLVLGGLASTEPARAAARFLVEAQLEDGDWPRGKMVGVFNRTTLIHYDNYRRSFPLLALSTYSRAGGLL
jgi:squalene/oxidosqualene cyclase-like protein